MSCSFTVPNGISSLRGRPDTHEKDDEVDVASEAPRRNRVIERDVEPDPHVEEAAVHVERFAVVGSDEQAKNSFFRW